MKTKCLLFCLLNILFGVSVYAQNDCGNNAGFELGGSAGWVCKYGTYGSPPGICPTADAFGCPVFPINLDSIGCLNKNGIDALATANGNRHTIVTMNYRPWAGAGEGMDSISNNTVPVVAPGLGNYSFRLGNAIGGGTGTIPNYAQAEAIRLTFPVSPANAGFTYLYSAFIQDTIHDPESSPRFEVRVLDSADHTIPCGNYSFIAGTSNGYCSTTKDSATWKKGVGLWQYTDWNYVGLDLSYYLGQIISVEFRTADCIEKDTGSCNYKPGPHSAYAYIDAYCAPIQPPPPPVDTVLCGDTITLCGHCPGPILCSYSWNPGGATTECIKVVVDSSEEYDLYSYKSGSCPSIQRMKFFCVVGLNELSNDNPFSIFPNPVTNSFSLSLKVPLMNIEVVIFDMPGREMIRKKFSGEKLEIERGNLAGGIYLVSVRTEEGQWVQKIVIE